VLRSLLLLFVSFSAGGLLGDAFLHLIPQSLELPNQTPLMASAFALAGIIVFFVLEKIIHWHHSVEESQDHRHVIGTMSLTGGTLHNFIDGVVVAGSYLVSIPLGFTTTLAVILHELPHEFSDFAVLLHAGFPRKKAFLYNFLSALAAIAGALLILLLHNQLIGIEQPLIPFTAGGFIYVALADLLPEFKHQSRSKTAVLQLALFLLGIGLMAALLALE